MSPNVPVQVQNPVTSQPSNVSNNIVTAAKGGGIVFGGKLFTFGARFIIAVLLARLLGAEQYGLYNLALTAVNLASGLAMLGLQQGAIRYIAQNVSRNDTAGIWGTLQISLGLTSLVSIFIGAGMYIFADPIAQQLFEEPDLAPLIRITSVVAPFLSLSNMVAAATRGFKEMRYSTLAQDIIQPTIRLVLILAFAVIGLNAIVALNIFAVTIIAITFVLLFFLNKQFSLLRSINSAQRNTKEILIFSFPVYLSDLIKTFRQNIQTILLGIFNTVTNVGIFAIATQVNRIGDMFHTAIITTSMPIVSELFEKEDFEQLGRFYQTMTKWTFTLNIPFFLLVILFSEEILAIFGKNFVNGAAALSLLAWANLVNTGTGISGVVLDMSGKTNLKLVNSVISFTFTIGLNLVLIPLYGLMGAAIVALVATVTLNSLRLVQLYVMYRLQPYNFTFLKPVIAGSLTLVAMYAGITAVGLEKNFFFLIVAAPILIMIYAGLIFLLGLSAEDRAVLDRLQRRVAPRLPWRKKS